MKRRSLVLTTGTILFGAGCTTSGIQGGDGSPSSTPTATTTATEAPEQSETTPSNETEPQASESMTQSPDEGVSLQSALVYRTHPDAAAVAGPDKAQFLLVRVSLDHESAPPETAFSVHIGDQSFAPADVSGTRFVGDGETRRRYEQDRGTGWLVFNLPTITTQDATGRLTANGQVIREIALDSSRVADSPLFEVREVTIQDGCLSFEVENTGERAGTFYGVFNGSGSAFYYYVLQVEVGSGGKATRRECYPEARKYEFQWATGSETGDSE